MPTTSGTESIIPLAVAGTTGDISFNLSMLVSSAGSTAIVLDASAALLLSWPAVGASSDVAIYVPVEPSRPRSAPWPPPWFSSVRAARADTAERTEEILSAEFGRNDSR
jgi:hypothetical protein